MNHQAIILAAGLGRRLGQDKPKCLIEIGGQSFLERTLKALAPYRLPLIQIVTGYKSEMIEDFVKTNPIAKELPIQLVLNNDFATTNNAVSLFCALKKDKSKFVLFDGDLLFDPKILDLCMKAPNIRSLMIDTDKSRLNPEAMKAEMTGENVTRLSKEITVEQACGEYIGLLRCDQLFADRLLNKMHFLTPQEKENAYYEDILNKCLKEGYEMAPISTKKLFWSEIDSPEDLKLAEENLKKQN